jgi:hypothetical protein
MEIVDTKYDYPAPETVLSPEEVVGFVTESMSSHFAPLKYLPLVIVSGRRG